MATTVVATGYVPRHHQQLVHSQLQRFSVLVCHRRFGKTVLSVNELVDRCVRNRRPAPRYAYIAPLYRQAKAIAWDYLKTYTAPIGAKANEAELRVDLPGDRRIQLFGADNYDSLRGVYLDGVVLDEYAQIARQAWTEVIRPALSDRKGWALFIGTPKGDNQFKQLYDDAGFLPNWYRAIFRASETGIVDEEELADARRQMTEAEYAQEFECSWSAAIVGAYYAKVILQAEKDERIGRFPYDSGQPVHTAWDVGNTNAVWFFQRHALEVHVIDYLECDQGVPATAKLVIQKPYVFGTHIYPSDVEVDQPATGKSLHQTLSDYGLRGEVLPPQRSVDNGIAEVEKAFSRFCFHEPGTKSGLNVLRQYRREWSEKGKTWRPNPLHDWASHGADAFRYLVLGLDRVESTFTSEFNREIEYHPLGVA